MNALHCKQCGDVMEDDGATKDCPLCGDVFDEKPIVPVDPNTPIIDPNAPAVDTDTPIIDPNAPAVDTDTPPLD